MSCPLGSTSTEPRQSAQREVRTASGQHPDRTRHRTRAPDPIRGLNRMKHCQGKLRRGACSPAVQKRGTADGAGVNWSQHMAYNDGLTHGRRRGNAGALRTKRDQRAPEVANQRRGEKPGEASPLPCHKGTACGWLVSWGEASQQRLP